MSETFKKVRIRESQIEDVLATCPDITKEVLATGDEITLIARQKILPSGNRADLLFIAGTSILLVELKVTFFRDEFLVQVGGYARELTELQRSRKLVNGDILPFILCTDFREEENAKCLARGVRLTKYEPENVLANFFARFKNMADFIVLKPTNHGLWNIHLLNRMLHVLWEPRSKSDVSKDTGLSESTMGSYLRLARELLLVSGSENGWVLTDVGKEFARAGNIGTLRDLVSDEQSRILQDVIIHNPFASGAIFGVYTLVEAVFDLARNTYPVPEELLMNYFKQSSGRLFEWKTKKTTFDSMKMYSNYSIDIGLIGKIGTKFYLTPDGIRFILLLNLHKAITIIDALGISRTEAFL